MIEAMDLRPVGESDFLITWADGHRSLYPYRYLRLQCPCAGCLDEWTGKRLVALDRIREDIKSSEPTPAGRYALRFLWSDGHQTGIYSFEFLRSICPCESCQTSKAKGVRPRGLTPSDSSE